MKDQESFKPYIPAEKITAEMTATSVIMGIILSVVFGAANAYLGLRVGMTVSASIPAAVISMGVIRVLLKKNSILESNMVQTIGTAGRKAPPVQTFCGPVKRAVQTPPPCSPAWVWQPSSSSSSMA